MKNRTLVLIALCIALNIGLGQAASTLKLPIFLDSIGTVLAALLMGPWVGMATGLVTNLLPVIDDLERAVDHAEGTGNSELTQFVEGITAVHAKILSVLEKEGVAVIDPAGQPFDPLAHQAVGREERTDVYDETVAQVYQKGYRMGGKIIRSAMVTVTFGGPKRPAEEPEAEE